MIAMDELQYTINRCGLVVNNSSSEEEKFIAVQTVQALQQVLHALNNWKDIRNLSRWLLTFLKTR